jgi:hypothetical protein
MSVERPSDDIIRVFRHEFVFRANCPDHAAAVRKRVLDSADHQALVFDSAVMYQKAGSGGLSQVIVKFVSPNQMMATFQECNLAHDCELRQATQPKA